MRRFLILSLFIASGCVPEFVPVPEADDPDALEAALSTCEHIEEIPIEIATNLPGAPDWPGGVAEDSHVTTLPPYPFEVVAGDLRAFAVEFAAHVESGDSLECLERVEIEIDGALVAHGSDFGDTRRAHLETRAVDVASALVEGFELTIRAVGTPPAQDTRIASTLTIWAFSDCDNEKL